MSARSEESRFNHQNGARLLSLDGGGVRGIVSLMILDDIMKRVQKKRRLSELPLPADYFELAAGTSTGGIIAIMLFRLRMTTEQAIEEYKIISQEVFQPSVYGWKVPKWADYLVNNCKAAFTSTRFDPANLEKAIDRVVEKYGLDSTDKEKKGEALLYHPRASKMFVCTTAQNREETVLLRTYLKNIECGQSVVNRAMEKAADEITISQAVKATSAAPTYFPELTWTPRHMKEHLVFWDGGLLNNNPIDQLWYARYDVVGREESEPPVSCVISLGTGYIRPGNPTRSWYKLTGIFSAVVGLATTTNAKAKDFMRHMSDLKGRPSHEKTSYLRFSPHLKDNNIDLADYTKVDLLIELTRAYLLEETDKRYLQEAVDSICPCDTPPQRQEVNKTGLRLSPTDTDVATGACSNPPHEKEE